MIDPQIVKNLSETPDFAALVDHFKSEADKLNHLDDIALTDAGEIALEVKSRQNAYKTLLEICTPLLFSDKSSSIKATQNDFNVLP